MNLDSTISIDEVVRLIVERDTRPGDDLRSSEDRARHRVRYAIKNGSLREKDGALLPHFVCVWLKKKWPGKFDDLPEVWWGDIDAWVCITVTAPPPAMPADLQTAHRLILSMHEKIQSLEAEIKALKPDAVKWRELKAFNQANARKPRPRSK